MRTARIFTSKTVSTLPFARGIVVDETEQPVETDELEPDDNAALFFPGRLP